MPVQKESGNLLKAPRISDFPAPTLHDTLLCYTGSVFEYQVFLFLDWLFLPRIES